MKKPSKLRTIALLLFAAIFIFTDIVAIFAAHDLLMAYHHAGASIFPLEELHITHDMLWLILAAAIFLSTLLALVFLILAIKSAIRNLLAQD